MEVSLNVGHLYSFLEAADDDEDGRYKHRKGPKRTEKDRKGPKRTEKDRKGTEKDRKGLNNLLFTEKEAKSWR